MTSAFELADQLVSDVCALSPTFATSLGVPGRDHEWGSFGLSAIAEQRALRRRYRDKLAEFVDYDEARDRLAAQVMLAQFEEAEESDAAGDHFLELRHMASPFHRIRSTFDVMGTSTADQRDDIVARLQTVPEPLQDLRDLFQKGVTEGTTVAARQVESVIAQARSMADDPASFEVIASRLEASGLRTRAVDDAVSTARLAIGRFGEWLQELYLPHAREDEGVGREAYMRAADRMVGRPVDPNDAYEWGWEEFHRLRSEMELVAEEIQPGADVETVKEYLESDPLVTVSGTGELVDFVERTLAAALDDLAGSHFDVPATIRPLTVNIAPPGTPLGAYYLRPSEDFTRPGGVWYSIGDQQVFPLYQHISTAYHEGFPGHHLQVATAMLRSEDISRFQRVLVWYPGYGEGWGMYAEVLMGELGYLDNPHHYFGMLAKQMYRAARVVVDIGLHLDRDVAPSSPIAPGEPWSFEIAVEFMRVFGFRTADQARDEVLRYLGWPGQAIAYKLGEREILSIREQARRRLGDRFDLREFHAVVLNHGAMRLDRLRDLVVELLPA